MHLRHTFCPAAKIRHVARFRRERETDSICSILYGDFRTLHIHRAALHHDHPHVGRPALVLILGSGNSDRLPLTDWQSQVDLGNATVNREQGPDGKTLLHIKTQEKCAASWRTRLALDAGSYRFEGKARCQDVILAADDSRSGAGLRISRRKFNEKLSGDSEWRTIRHDFEVREDQSEVELVCELRAARGEIWFDLGSLRLLRR